MVLIFHQSFQKINPRFLDKYLKEMHNLVNDFDNAIYEIDIDEPRTFIYVVRVLEPLVEKRKGLKMRSFKTMHEMELICLR